MTVKQWLERAGKIEYEISTLKETLQNIEDRLYSVTGKVAEEKVQESRINRQEVTLYKYMHLKEMLSRRIGNLLSVQAEAVTLIERLENPMYRVVLMERYINGKTIPQISDGIGFTVRWTAQLIERALKEIAVFFRKNKMSCL